MTDPATFAAIKAVAAHGTAARYEGGCRCDPCTTANRDKARRRRARRAADNPQRTRGQDGRRDRVNEPPRAPSTAQDLAPRWAEETDDDWTDNNTPGVAGASSLQLLMDLATQLRAAKHGAEPATNPTARTQGPQRTSPVMLSGHVELAGGPCRACDKPAPLHTACPWCGHRPSG